MTLCSYGCNREATHKFKNGRWCCENNAGKCPGIYIKCRNEYGEICPYCNKKFCMGGAQNHIAFCYKNPDNLRLCPVCNNPIKNYKQNTTCSVGCANTYFRSNENNPNWKENKTHYRYVCFKYHKKRCVICMEKIIVEVHHYDEDNKNESPENLIPLCPTHHKYWHSRYKYIIAEGVENYRNNFIKNNHNAPIV